jgi:hypothetical protein
MSCGFAQANLDCNHPLYVSCVSGMEGTHHHAQLIDWQEGLANFLPELASNLDLPYLHFLSSWNYKGEPPCPAKKVNYFS